MNLKEVKDYSTMLREVGRDYVETGEIFTASMKGVAQEVRSTKKLWRSNNRSPLIKLGVALILFPDPIISDILGSAMVAAGLVHDKIKNSGLYLEDVYKAYPRLLKELYLTK
jgi:hypothetical protein